MIQAARVAIGALTICMLGVTAACGQDSAPAVPPVNPSPVSAVAPVPGGAPVRPDHVVIVVLENKNEPDVAREAPYLTSLARSGASLTDMHAETHPSQPNY